MQGARLDAGVARRRQRAILRGGAEVSHDRYGASLPSGAQVAVSEFFLSRPMERPRRTIPVPVCRLQASGTRSNETMSESVRIRALREAARLLGGAAKLRDRLQSSSADIAEWLAGVKEPPEVLLRAVDLILDELDARD
jgi:hypothetical protein